MGPKSIARFLRPKAFLHKTNAEPDPWWPRGKGPCSPSATGVLAALLCGEFDNTAQIEAERQAGKQLHPYAKHVSRVINPRIRNLPASHAAGVWILEESYYTPPETDAVTSKPLLLYFEPQGDTAVLHSFKWPATIEPEELRNDNPDLWLDFETLQESPGFTPAPYTRRGEEFSIKVAVPLPKPGMVFTLEETLTPTGLTVMESLTSNGTLLTPYDTPLEYRRVAPPASVTDTEDMLGGCDPDSQPPTLFRRTTLLVADIERSLAVYRDALGLEVIFDNVVPIGGKGLPTGVFDTKAQLHRAHPRKLFCLRPLDRPNPKSLLNGPVLQARLVFLKSYDDDKVACVGLLCFDSAKPLAPLPSGPRRKLQLGDSVLLLNTTGVAARMAQLKNLDGVFVQSEGSESVYPTASGGTCKVLGNSFFDPDGHFVELNEVTW